MVLKKDEVAPRFAGFKRFELSDVVEHEGKKVIHLPGSIDPESAETLRKSFKLMNGVDDNNEICIAVVREFTPSNPAFNEFPKISSKESDKDFVLLGLVYKDRVTSSNKKMAVKLARMLKLNYKEDA
jgi:hypothetical protein